MTISKASKDFCNREFQPHKTAISADKNQAKLGNLMWLNLL